MPAAHYSSKDYSRMALEMQAFIDGLDRFQALSQATPMMAVLNSWEVPKDGKQDEWESARSDLDVLAGSAAYGVDAAGAMIRSRDETGAPVVLNVVASWAHITQPKAMFDRSDLRSTAQQTVGRLIHLAKQKAAEERSFAGRLAAVFGFPSRVRELAGFPRGSAAGRTTQWTIGAILFAVVTGVVGSAIWALVLLMLKL